MNRDSSDDTGKPFDPETPEDFFQRGEEAFRFWWSQLDPPGSADGLELEYESARAVWSAAYEHSAACIMVIYDGAESNAGAVPMCEAELACVIHRHHRGKMTLRSRDFFEWIAEHEDHIRREYDEDEHDPDADTLRVWIDRAGQSPPPAGPTKTVPTTCAEDLRTSADEEFSKWWKQLAPAATLEWTILDRDKALVVWREAFVRLWEDLEVVHDNSTAHVDVIEETASLELAYIIDRFHNGRLSFFVNDVSEFWSRDQFVLERHRTNDTIDLQIVCVNDGDES